MRKFFGTISFIVALVIVFFWSSDSLDQMIAGQRNWAGYLYLVALVACIGFGCWALFAPRKA